MLSPVSAGQALRLVPAGGHLVAAPGCGAPTTLLEALPEACPGREWTLATGILLGELAFVASVDRGDLRYRTWHVPAVARGLVAAGTADYVPLRASRVAAHLASWKVDAALVRVSPPDREGNVSLGGSVGYSLDALRLARVRIAEVDPQVPRTHGDTTVPLSLFDALVDSDQPIPEYQSAEPSATSSAIARHILELIPRDPVLQIGIGGIPESVLAGLAGADLGRVRFEGMGGDAMVDLFERGVLDPRERVPHPALRSPELMGTARLMQFAHDNPAIGLYPSSSSHDTGRLGDLERLVSVNAAIEVDLRGQVNAETVRGRPVAGVGGALDFVEAAGRSRGGLRIVALASASPDGSASRIVRDVATVTVPSAYTDVIVTEYGVARLEGLSVRERAEAILAIVHPQHRDALSKD